MGLAFVVILTSKHFLEIPLSSPFDLSPGPSPISTVDLAHSSSTAMKGKARPLHKQSGQDVIKCLLRQA
jgi:hypothetical protein